MRIVRNPVLKSDKRIPVTIIIIAVVMFILSIIDVTITFSKGVVALNLGSLGMWSSLLSIIPLSWGLCTGLLLKTKKVNFAKIPAYIICAMIALAYALYIVIAGQKNSVTNILLFSLAVLLIYPFVISTLTLEGRLYNRVFATLFTSILLGITFIGAVIYFVLKGAVIFTLLLPTLMYVELLLIVFCFNLEKPTKNTEKKTVITH
mgnify:CR=1 FL=1